MRQHPAPRSTRPRRSTLKRGVIAMLSAVGVAALAAFSLQCGVGKSTGVPCDDSYVAKCAGDTLSACASGTVTTLDCTTQQMHCIQNGKGENTCGKLCPKAVDKYGYCSDDKLQTCDGKVLNEHDCKKDEQKCGYTKYGYASCTKPCPTPVDPLGACAGTKEQRCDGEVLLELDCAQQHETCALQADGESQCTLACPPGTSPYGTCASNISRICDGKVFRKEDCTALKGKCEQTSRFGTSCRTCGPSTAVGKCSLSEELTICDEQGKFKHESCIGRGGKCEWSDDSCSYACVGTTDRPPCSKEGLKPGESKCKTNAATKFASIVTCGADGKVVETECPASTDGSIACVPMGGKPTCVAAECPVIEKRCTDRGVLIRCKGTAILGWIDCNELGGKCVDTGTDAVCTCAGSVPDYAGRCEATRVSTWPLGVSMVPFDPDAGTDGGGGGGAGGGGGGGGGGDADGGDAGDAGDAGPAGSQQYVCNGGMIDVAGCACAKP